MTTPQDRKRARDALYKARERRRKRALDLVPVEIWVPRGAVATLREIAKTLTDPT